FLAGTRLTGDQHGRVGLGDLGGLRQHLLPLARAPESPVRAGALQLLDALLEPRGLLLSLAGARRLLGEALGGERPRNVVGDPAAQRHVLLPVLVGPARGEEQVADALTLQANGQAQLRTDTALGVGLEQARVGLEILGLDPAVIWIHVVDANRVWRQHGVV